MTIRTPPSVTVTHIKSMSKTDFKSMFTATEYRAINNRVATDDIVFQFWDMAQTADHIDVGDLRTLQAIQYIAGLGDLTSDRANVILLGKPV